MNEPADDDFDFDAHIAKLIARRYANLFDARYEQHLSFSDFCTHFFHF